MPRIERIPVITVVSGVNGSIIDSQSYNKYRIEGTAILASNWEVVLLNSSGGAGTPVANMTVEFEYKATVTLGGNHITILGSQMPDEYASKELTIRCYYNGSAWIVKFEPDFQEIDIIKTSQIIDANVTLNKIENLTRGNVIVGNASNRPTSTANGTGGVAILLHDNTDCSFKAISSDITIASTGAATIGNAKVDKDKIASSAIGNGLTGGSGTAIAIKPDTTNGTSIVVSSDGARLTGDITSPGLNKMYGTNELGIKTWINQPEATEFLSTIVLEADILTLNSSPIELLSDITTPYFYVIDSAEVAIYPDTVYATNVKLQIITDTCNTPQYECSQSLVSTVNRKIAMEKVFVSADTDTQYRTYKKVLLKVDTGDPTCVGTGGYIAVTISYRKVFDELAV